MKILINGVSARSGGGVVYLSNLLRYLPKACPEHQFLAAVPDISLPEFGCKNLEVRVFRDASGNAIKRYFWENSTLLDLCRSGGFDHLFCLANMIPLRSSGVPTTVVIQNIAPFSREYMKRLFRFEPVKEFVQQSLIRYLSIFAVKRSSATVSLSKHADKVLKRFCPSARSIVIHHGVDKSFRPDQPKPWQAGDSKYFLFVSNVLFHKGLEYIVEALALNRALPKVFVLGKVLSSKYFERITSMVEERKLKNRIEFLAWVPNETLPAWYSNAEALIFPSWCESFGMPALEAVACGCPVVAFKHGPVEEILGENGFYADLYDSASLATSMQAVLSSDKSVFAEKCKAVSFSKSWQKSMEKYRCLFS